MGHRKGLLQQTFEEGDQRLKWTRGEGQRGRGKRQGRGKAKSVKLMREGRHDLNGAVSNHLGRERRGNGGGEQTSTHGREIQARAGTKDGGKGKKWWTFRECGHKRLA